MLPSFTRLHIAVRAPAHDDALPTGMQSEDEEDRGEEAVEGDSRERRERKKVARERLKVAQKAALRSAKQTRATLPRSGPSMIPQDRLQLMLKPSDRTQHEPQKSKMMSTLIDHFVTEQFRLKWKHEQLEAQNWTLQEQNEIPAVFEFAFGDASINCDIVCLNTHTHAVALVVCTLHTQRNFVNALGEVLRHGYYYGIGNSSSTESMVGIIALNREPHRHEKNMALAHKVQCWWPNQSIADCLLAA